MSKKNQEVKFAREETRKRHPLVAALWGENDSRSRELLRKRTECSAWNIDGITPITCPAPRPAEIGAELSRVDDRLNASVPLSLLRHFTNLPD